MAGTAGSGGLGALGIGGIAAAAVVAGGVAAYLAGVFETGEAPQPETQPAALAPANGNSVPAEVAQETAEPDIADAPAPSEQPGEAPEIAEGTAAEPAGGDTAAAEAGAPSGEAAETEQPVAEDNAEAASDAAPDEETAAAETPQAEPVAEDDAAAADQPAETGEALAEAAELAEAEQPAEDAQAAAEDTPATAGQQASADPDAFVLAAPQLDTVRFEPDGNGLISGRAQPGVEISVLLENEVLDRFSVAAGGEFAVFVTVPPSENQRVLSLLASHAGQSAASDASFILGPIRLPVALAEAEAAPAEDAAPAETPADEAVPAEDAGTAETPAGTATAEAAPDTEAAVAGEQPGATAEDAAEPSEGAPADAEAPAVQQVTEVPDAVAVLRADSSGITIVQPGAGNPADGVALDTLSYSDRGNVEVAGRARAEAFLRLYVDNELVEDLRSSAEGAWTASLPGIDPGGYTLRVDEVNAQGIVLSRVETPFTREAPELLAEAAPEADPQAPEPLLRAITVRKGDTLWAISRKTYGDGRLYVRLFDANRNEIKDPDLIYPGQVFALPE